MILILDLVDVDKNLREPFCNYLIENIQKQIINQYDKDKATKLEDYINSNKIIRWQYNINKYISVYDLYKLYAFNLHLDKENDAKFIIGIDENINIPDAYTRLRSIIALLEYGSLSVRKYGLISDIYSNIVKDIDTYYNMFKTGEIDK